MAWGKRHERVRCAEDDGDVPDLATGSSSSCAVSCGPIAQQRLTRTADGRVLLTLKAEWTDGTTNLLFETVELLERLAALTLRPRIKLGAVPRCARAPTVGGGSRRSSTGGRRSPSPAASPRSRCGASHPPAPPSDPRPSPVTELS
jgi:hypothetical protein